MTEAVDITECNQMNWQEAEREEDDLQVLSSLVSFILKIHIGSRPAKLRLAPEHLVFLLLQIKTRLEVSTLTPENKRNSKN